ncbi:MAG: hypothetical protein JNK12_16050 [Acidimicrobiales bacterium]|nr:hypothetical protein [Acidimicrobiales bacterium]
MGRHSRAIWATVGLLVGAVVVVLIVGADQDQGVPPVNDTDPPLDAAAYAARVSALCNESVEAAETTGYEESSEAGAVAMRAVAADLAALSPPVDQQGMAQALVDGVAEYAHLFQVRDEDEEAFSQRQNAVTVVIEARAAGLGADCGESDIVLVPSVPPPPEDVAAETDPAIVDLATACHEGALDACDDLFDSDSSLRFYGGTCGERLYYEEADFTYSCVETFAGDRPSGDQP